MKFQEMISVLSTSHNQYRLCMNPLRFVSFMNIYINLQTDVKHYWDNAVASHAKR